MTSNRNVSPGDIIQAIDFTAIESDQQRRNALATLQRVLCAEAVPLARELDRYTQKYGGAYPGVVELAVRLETNQGFTSDIVKEIVRANIAPLIVDEHTFAVHGLFQGPGGTGLTNLTVALYDGPTESATWVQEFGHVCTTEDGYFILKGINPGATPVFLQARNATGKTVFLSDTPVTPQAGFVSYSEIAISGEPLGCPPPPPPPPATVDLRITAVDSPDPVTPESDLVYTLTVTNQGQTNAKDLKVTDTLPAKTTFVSASGNGFTCTHSSGIVTCTLPTLAAGAMATITILVKVIKDVIHGSVLSNTATVTATSINPNATNNTAVTTTTVVSAADLSIAMTDAPDPVVAGQNVTYTLLVNNPAGALAAQNVTVTGAVPANTTFVSATVTSGTGWTAATPAVGGSGNVVISKASVAAGESATFKIVVKVNTNPAVTIITNTAAVASSTTDSNAANNSASTTTTVKRPSAHLSIIKTDAPKKIAPGGTVTYSLAITNNGPDAAENVTVTDTIPANTALISATVTSGVGWTAKNSLASSGSAVDVVFSKPSVANLETASFEIVIQVDKDTAPTIENTATVASSTTNPNPDNQTATTTTTVKPVAADLSIIKTDTPDPVAAGQNVTYTLQVTNAVDASAAQSVTVTDAVPANTSFVSATVTSGSGWTATTPVAGGPGNVVFWKASVAAGETASFQIVVKVDTATTVTSITNTATVSSPTSDPNADNNSQTVTTSVIPLPASADLRIDKTATPGEVRPDDNVTCTLTVTNAGPSAAQNVTVTDAVPANTSFVSATVTSGTGWTVALPKAGSGSVVFSKASVASNESATFQIVIKVNADKPVTSISNTAMVASSTSDPNPKSNASTVAISVIPTPTADLQILKTDDPNKVAPGGNITYTLMITNAGPSPAQNVTVTDSIPANTTFVSAAVTIGSAWTAATPAVGGSGNVVFSKASVAAGENATFQIAVKVNQNTTATAITSTATVASPTSDPVSTNNTAETSTKVRALTQTRVALLVFSTAALKTGVHTVAPGSTQTRFTFINNALQDTAVTDSLKGIPAGFQVVGVTLADVLDAQLDSDAPARLDAVVKAIQGAKGVSAGLVAKPPQLLSAADRTQLAKDSVSLDGVNDVIYVELIGLAVK